MFPVIFESSKEFTFNTIHNLQNQKPLKSQNPKPQVSKH